MRPHTGKMEPGLGVLVEIIKGASAVLPGRRAVLVDRNPGEVRCGLSVLSRPAGKPQDRRLPHLVEVLADVRDPDEMLARRIAQKLEHHRAGRRRLVLLIAPELPVELEHPADIRKVRVVADIDYELRL